MSIGGYWHASNEFPVKPGYIPMTVLCEPYYISVFGALVYIDVDKAAIKALLTLMYIPLKDT